MKSVTILSVSVIAIIFMVAPTNSQAGIITAKNTNIEISGLIGVDAPMHTGEDYRVRWSRLRVEATSTEVDQLIVRFEYDLATNNVKYAYAKKSYPLFSGKISTMVGKQLTPDGFLMPAPNSLLFGRWSGAFADYGVYAVGASVTFEKSNFTIRALHADLMQVSIVYGLASAMWQEKTAMGVVLESPFDFSLLEMTVIASVSEHGQEQYTIRNYSHLTEKLSFNQMIDFGQKDMLTLGYAYEYATKSFLKGYVDLSEEMRPEYFLEITCTF